MRRGQGRPVPLDLGEHLTTRDQRLSRVLIMRTEPLVVLELVSEVEEIKEEGLFNLAAIQNLTIGASLTTAAQCQSRGWGKGEQ